MVQRAVDGGTIPEPDIAAGRLQREEGKVVAGVEGGKLVSAFSPKTDRAAKGRVPSRRDR